MNKEITIIDYGVGNILSIKNAISFYGNRPVVTNDPVKIEVFRDENNGTIEKPKIVKVVMPVSKYNNNYNSVAFFHDNNGNVYVSGYNVYNYYKNLTLKQRIKGFILNKSELNIQMYNKWMTGVYDELINTHLINKDISDMAKKQ